MRMRKQRSSGPECYGWASMEASEKRDEVKA